MKKRSYFSGGDRVRFQFWKQAVLAVLLLLTVAFMYDGYRRSRRTAIESYADHQSTHARQMCREISFKFQLIRDVLDLWSQSRGILYFSGETPFVMQRILEAHSSYISGVTRTDKRGSIVYTFPVDSSAAGTDISHQEHMKQILEDHQPVMSNAFLTVQGYWAIAYHYPCIDSLGQYNGSLAFLVPYQRMFEEHFAHLLSEDHVAHVVLDGRGTVLFSPVSSHAGLHYTDAFEGDPGMMEVADMSMAGASEYILSSVSSFAEDEEEPLSRLSMMFPLELEGGTWSLILSVPESEVMKHISGLSNRWLFGMGAVILLALIYTTLKLRAGITKKEEKKWRDVAHLRDILQRTVNQAEEVVLILDRTESVIYANMAAVKTSGLGKECFGVRIGRVPLRDFKPSINEIRKEVVAKGSWSGRVTGVGAGDRFFRLDTTISSVKDDSGFVSNYIVIARNVTAQVEMERRLMKQQKMEVIGQLAGGIAHDFNNLLVGILGYAELLKQGHREGSEVYKAAEVIESAVHKASDLTSQLLGYARRGKHRIELVDMAEMIRTVEKLLRRTIDRRIEVGLDLEDDVYVKGDATQIEQVILNLAVNARDAMPEGGKLVFSLRKSSVPAEVLSGSRTGEDMDLAVFETRDTGCGISQEDIERIFEPFFTTKDHEGTGMGLATVYGIVANHGGWVDVDSSPGRGSVFTVYLPLTEKDRAEEDEPESSGSIEKARRGRILIVDDEYVVVSTLTQLLEEIGYTTESVPGGRQALEVYSSDPGGFDAVILDLSMPVMDGLECYRELRELDPSVKVILATGFSRDGRVQELLDMGVNGFLQKPFRLRELADMLQAVL